MKNKLFIWMILFMVVVSCKDSPEKISTEIETKTPFNIKIKTKTPIKIPTVPTYSIRENQVGLFKIGYNIPTISAVYKIDKIEKTRATDSGPVTETVYVLSQNNTKGLLLLPKEKAKNNVKKIIDEIWVLSEKYKTKEGIGVGASLKDFQKAYPNFNIWYTYVSDRFIIENEKSSVQFILNEKDFIGKMEVDRVKVPLKISDFRRNAQIAKIRVYQ